MENYKEEGYDSPVAWHKPKLTSFIKLNEWSEYIRAYTWILYSWVWIENRESWSRAKMAWSREFVS
jgi:hypothetical protein